MRVWRRWQQKVPRKRARGVRPDNVCVCLADHKMPTRWKRWRAFIAFSVVHRHHSWQTDSNISSRDEGEWKAIFTQSEPELVWYNYTDATKMTQTPTYTHFVLSGNCHGETSTTTLPTLIYPTESGSYCGALNIVQRSILDICSDPPTGTPRLPASFAANGTRFRGAVLCGI